MCVEVLAQFLAPFAAPSDDPEFGQVVLTPLSSASAIYALFRAPVAAAPPPTCSPHPHPHVHMVFVVVRGCEHHQRLSVQTGLCFWDASASFGYLLSTHYAGDGGVLRQF